jgi:three-Cys-motif partner protein
MSDELADSVGPWAKEKLEALGRYLDFYTKVLKNQPWQTIYVDAYAGGGRALLRAPAREAAPLLQDQPDAELVQLISGSPRVALEVANPFNRYVLIEPDPTRAARLEALREQYRDSRQIDVLREDAASGIGWLLRQDISRAASQRFRGRKLYFEHGRAPSSARQTLAGKTGTKVKSVPDLQITGGERILGCVER